MAPLFRADQIGSLIRPAELQQALRGVPLFGKVTSAEHLDIIARNIKDVAKKQLDRSVRPITMGEYDRTIFHSGFFENLQGMEARFDLPIDSGFRQGAFDIDGLKKLGIKQWSAVPATGKIAHDKPCYLASWETLKEAVPPELWKECKLTVPPITLQHIHLRPGQIYPSDVYASDKEYFTDLAAAFRKEVLILYDAGLRNIQVDDPTLANFLWQDFKDGLEKDGIDPGELLDLYVWAHNEAIKDLPQDLHVGIHICRGNAPGPMSIFNLDISLSFEWLAQKAFSGMKYNTFYLQHEDENAESFRFIPKGTNVVMGVVNTKSPELDDLDVLAKRVRAGAEVMAKAQGRTAEEVLSDSIAVSPTCGFATVAASDGVGGEERMWEKFALLQDLAKRIWPETSDSI